MIRGIHGLFYSSDPEATRLFFKDKVKLPGSDIGEGWWIFDFPEGDLGIHPVEDASDAGGHDISFYCDDLAGTVKELRGRGVEFTQEIQDHGYGLVTYFSAPGGIRVQLYEPRYTKGTSRKPAAKTAKTTKAAKAAKAAKVTKVTKKKTKRPAAKKRR
jgi:hypothetical protein